MVVLKILTYFVQFTSISFLFVVCFWYFKYWSFRRHLRYFPQVRQVPVFGCALDITSGKALYSKLIDIARERGPIFWGMVGMEPMMCIADPKLLEAILSSPKCIDKARTYVFFQKWLGLGLFTSSGERWKVHRKILTPAFHFKILEEFTDTFNPASDVLVEMLTKELESEFVDVFPYITLCSLDAVCESVMGASVNAQRDAHSAYVRSVTDICSIIVDRSTRIVENFEITYQFTRNYRREKAALKVLHDFSNSLIQQKRAAQAHKAGDNGRKKVSSDNGKDANGRKKKMAFMDLLLHYSDNGNILSDQDIREHVDTFLFGGHDTMTTALSFALYLLANNPAEQDKAFAEIRTLFYDDIVRVATFEDLRDMKYLELVIKETLRLYPPGPLLLRELKHDMEYEGKTLPKGLTVMAMPYIVQRDPKIFKDPNTFNPERFSSQETQTKNAFSYIPFSAGPRNCIGQKFAMLAMKSIVSKVLRNFELLPVEYELVMTIETVLKSKNGVRIRLKKRKW